MECQPPVFTQIKDLQPNSRNVNIVFIVLEKEPAVVNKSGTIHSFLVADSTGCISCSVWDDPGQFIEPSDIISLKGAHAQLFKETLTLYCGRGSFAERVGEFLFPFTETPNISKLKWEFDDKDNTWAPKGGQVSSQNQSINTVTS